MTTKQYLAALAQLGLSPQGQATSVALGVSIRQLGRYLAGDAIPKPIELLLSCYLKHPNLLA